MEEKIYKSVHEVLARSYFAYFLFILVGFTVSFFWDQGLFLETKNDAGFALLVLGTILVFWAQSSSRRTKIKRIDPDKEISKMGFIKGPYKFYRSPTHLGVFLLSSGMAVLANSFVLALFSLLAFLFTKFVFIAQQDKMLKEKYGEAYEEYKKKVKI